MIAAVISGLLRLRLAMTNAVIKRHSLMLAGMKHALQRIMRIPAKLKPSCGTSLRGLCPKQSSTVNASLYNGCIYFWIDSPSTRNDERCCFT